MYDLTNLLPADPTELWRLAVLLAFAGLPAIGVLLVVLPGPRDPVPLTVTMIGLVFCLIILFAFRGHPTASYFAIAFMLLAVFRAGCMAVGRAARFGGGGLIRWLDNVRRSIAYEVPRTGDPDVTDDFGLGDLGSIAHEVPRTENAESSRTYPLVPLN